MALWDLLRNTETKSARPGASARATSNALSLGSGRFGNLALDQDNVEAVVNGHYRRVVLVFRCVDAIAQAQASLPMHVYESRDVNAKQVDGHDDVERLLNVRPNSYETAWQFRYRVSTLSLLSQMGVFVQKVPDKDTGKTAELHIIAPDSCQPIKDPKKFVSGYRVRTQDGLKDLKPEEVIWIRGRPHPTDPWKQIVPISSAGMAADTDYLCDVFNTRWLANDGRPSLVIGLSNGEIGFQPDDIDTLKRRFSGGPSRAGETSVIEADKVNVADLSGSPKDMQYQNLSDMSGRRIKMAYGVSDTFLGNADGKTFSNADAEEEGVWLKTMPQHCDPIAQAFEVLLPGGDDPSSDSDVIRHDFSGISATKRAARLEADRAMAEAQAGLRTWDSYFELTGEDKWNVPATKVLWIPNVGPVGKSEKDTEAARELLKASQPQPPMLPGAVDPETGEPLPPDQQPQGALPPGQQGPPALPPGASSNSPGQAAGQTQPPRGFAGARTQPRPVGGSDLRALEGRLRAVMDDRQAEQLRQSLLGQAKTRLARSPEHKSARSPRPVRRRRVARDDDDIVDAEVVHEEFDDPVEVLVKSVTADVARELGGLCRRMLGSIDGRLSGTKARKNTRHWEPSAEEKRAYKPRSQLSEFYIAQAQRWANEVRTDVALSVRSGASRAMAELREPTGIEAPGIVRASKLVQQLVNRLNADIEKGINKRVRRIQQIIREMDDRGADMQAIKDRVASEQAALDRWVAQVAPRVAQAAVNGSRKIMIDQVPDSVGVALWRSMRDPRVREPHEHADDQVAKRGQGWMVGGYRMAFPGDPRVPARLWAGCRCRVVFHRGDGTEY